MTKQNCEIFISHWANPETCIIHAPLPFLFLILFYILSYPKKNEIKTTEERIYIYIYI